VGLQPPKSPKLVIFWHKFAQKGYTPLSDFLNAKFSLGKGAPGLHPHAKFHRSGLKSMGLRPQKSRKMAIFGINLLLSENFGGS